MTLNTRINVSGRKRDSVWEHFDNEKFGSLIPVIMKFQAKSSPFHTFKFSDSVIKSMSAVEWWRSHSNVLETDVISSAQQLLSQP